MSTKEPCPGCGLPYEAEAGTCPWCLEELEPCPSCGLPFHADVRVCPKCLSGRVARDPSSIASWYEIPATIPTPGRAMTGVLAALCVSGVAAASSRIFDGGGAPLLARWDDAASWMALPWPALWLVRADLRRIAPLLAFAIVLPIAFVASFALGTTAWVLEAGASDGSWTAVPAAWSAFLAGGAAFLAATVWLTRHPRSPAALVAADAAAWLALAAALLGIWFDRA